MSARACIDPACVGFDADLHEYLDAADWAGFPLAEIPLPWAARVAATGPPGALAAAFAGVRVAPAQLTCIVGTPGNAAVDEPTFLRRLDELAGALDVVDILGCRRASVFFDVVGHGGAPLGPGDVAGRARAIAGTLRPAGVELAVGLVGADLLGAAAEVVERAGDGIGLLVDTVSLTKARLDPDWVDGLPVGSVAWLRVADVPKGRSPAALTYADRLLPGHGGCDLTAHVRAAARRGYAGPVSVEVGDPDLAALGRRDRARAAFDALESLLAEALG